MKRFAIVASVAIAIAACGPGRDHGGDGEDLSCVSCDPATNPCAAGLSCTGYACVAIDPTESCPGNCNAPTDECIPNSSCAGCPGWCVTPAEHACICRGSAAGSYNCPTDGGDG